MVSLSAIMAILITVLPPRPSPKFFKLFDVYIADALPGNVNKHPLIQLHNPVSWGLRINSTVFLGINLQILKLRLGKGQSYG